MCEVREKDSLSVLCGHCLARQPCSLKDPKGWSCPRAEIGVSEDWEELAGQG